jgi:hypothetical protein
MLAINNNDLEESKDRKMAIPDMNKKLVRIDGNIEIGHHTFPHEGRNTKMRHTSRQSCALSIKK